MTTRPLSAWFLFLGFAALALGGCSADTSPWRAKDLNPVTLHEAPGQPPVVFPANQPMVIVRPDPASRDLYESLNTLVRVVERATGVKPSVVTAMPATGPAVVLGDRPEAAALGLIGAKLPAEGFAIKTAPDRVYIVGNDGRSLPVGADNGRSRDGLAWGVYEFCERFVGARFYFPGDLGMTVPRVPQVVVPAISLSDAPAFAVREIWPSTSSPSNGSGTNLRPLHHALRSGGWWPSGPAIHQPDWSRTDLAKQRPEIFQKNSDGTRNFAMLCYGNPRTLETFLEEIDAAVNKTPGKHAGAGFMRGNTITVSPSDAEIACYCDDCRRLWNDKGGMYGSASPILAAFTQKLADEVKKRYPDKTVLHVPYLNYTTAAPGARFDGNVEAEVCGMPGLAMYKEPKVHDSEQANLDAWVKATGRPVQNWHYSCWPEDRTAAVYQYPHVVQRFYLENKDKTVGTFINGVTDHWPRQSLSLYIWLKCLWNPRFDVDAAIDAYASDLFGPAASPMRKLLEIEIEGWEKSRWPNSAMTAKNVYDVSYPPATIERLKSLLADARQAASGDAVVTQRIAYLTPSLETMFAEAERVARGATRQLDAQKVGEDPKVDGNLDDAVWSRATAAPFVRAHDRKEPTPQYPTQLKAVWTDRGVTFGFQMAEPTPERLEKSRMGRDHSLLWWDDNVEAVLDVTGKGQGAFYHFIFSAGNQVLDSKAGDTSYTADKVKSAVAIGKDGWSIEVFIPWSQFPEAVVPGSGTRTQWMANFTRHRVADCGLEPKPPALPGSRHEYQRLNTTFAGPTLNLSDLVPLRFVE